MGLYKFLKDENFESLDKASRVSYYYEKFYRYPSYRNLPFMTLYHLKKELTNNDISNIIEWYRNGEILRRQKNSFKRNSTVSINWDIDPQIIEERKKLISDEISFRTKIYDEYNGDLY